MRRDIRNSSFNAQKGDKSVRFDWMRHKKTLTPDREFKMIAFP